MNDYTLHLGDCLDKMSLIDDGSVDMILADLPYGTTACKWDTVIPFEPLWTHYKRVIKRNGAIVLFGSEPFSSLLRLSNLDWYKYDWVWEKDVHSNFVLAKYQPLKYHENIMVFSKDTCAYSPQMRETGKMSNIGGKGDYYRDCLSTKNGWKAMHRNNTLKYPKSIIQVNTPKHNDGINGCLHPTQKPVALLEYLIRTYTNEGETVLDNTMGSGSTIEAAMRAKRRSIGIEKDEGYFNIAKARLERVAAELRGEFVPKPANGKMADLPMFAGASL